MSYYTSPEVMSRLRIGLSKDDGNKPRLGCLSPTVEYGKTPGIEPFEVGIANGDILDIPEVEFPERLEELDRSTATLFDRIDADWARALTQGRCGYCWSYALICAVMAAIARDGRGFYHFSAASIAAQIKGGRDQGGWPVDAAKFAAEHGICLESEWNDCKCGGMGCGGPRSGCKARDLSQVEATRASAALTELKFYEVPRQDPNAWIKAILQGLPGAGGWTGTGAWADGHAMGVLHVIRDKRFGYRAVPENSWGMFKRRIPTERFPRGGVIVVRAKRKEA